MKDMRIVSFLLFLWNWISSLFFLDLNLFPPGGSLLAKIFILVYGHAGTSYINWIALLYISTWESLYMMIRESQKFTNCYEGEVSKHFDGSQKISLSAKLGKLSET